MPNVYSWFLTIGDLGSSLRFFHRLLYIERPEITLYKILCGIVDFASIWGAGLTWPDLTSPTGFIFHYPSVPLRILTWFHCWIVVWSFHSWVSRHQFHFYIFLHHSFALVSGIQTVSQSVRPSVRQPVTPGRLPATLFTASAEHAMPPSSTLPVGEWNLSTSGAWTLVAQWRQRRFVHSDWNIDHLNSRRWRSKSMFVPTLIFIAAAVQSP